jgi:hypothetical protein
VHVNQDALNCLCFNGGQDKIQPLYRLIREVAQRVKGKAKGALKVPSDAAQTLPHIHDIQLWLDSIEDGGHEDANYVKQLLAVLEGRVSDKFRKQVIREAD